MRKIEYRNVLKPSVDYLGSCGKLLLGSDEMAEFLGVPRKVVMHLATTDRIPMALQLGFDKHSHWSVLELLEWVEAGCPRRGPWVEMLRQRGWHRYW